jgi:hypothetical protein
MWVALKAGQSVYWFQMSAPSLIGAFMSGIEGLAGCG